jgi:hypothetical protein
MSDFHDDENPAPMKKATMPRFEIDFLDEYSDEGLLNVLRPVAALLSPIEALARRAFEESSPKVSHSTILKRFGGWKEALEKAGLGRG